MSDLPSHPRLFLCRAGDTVRLVDNIVEFHRVCLNGGTATLRFESEASARAFMARAVKLIEMEGEDA